MKHARMVAPSKSKVTPELPKARSSCNVSRRLRYLVKRISFQIRPSWKDERRVMNDASRRKRRWSHLDSPVIKMDSVEIVLVILLCLRVSLRHCDNSLFLKAMPDGFFKDG